MLMIYPKRGKIDRGSNERKNKIYPLYKLTKKGVGFFFLFSFCGRSPSGFKLIFSPPSSDTINSSYSPLPLLLLLPHTQHSFPYIDIKIHITSYFQERERIVAEFQERKTQTHRNCQERKKETKL